MKSRLVGLLLFWIGILYMFLVSWFAMWWIAPIWRNTAAEQFTGTIWAFGGPVFTTIALSAPAGILLAVTGIFLYARTSQDKTWPFLVFVIGGVLVSLSMMFPATIAYYTVFFGIAGGLIYLFFFSALWYWGKNQRLLTGGARLVADFQLISYLFFLIDCLSSLLTSRQSILGFTVSAPSDRTECSTISPCNGDKDGCLFRSGLVIQLSQSADVF